MSDLSCGQIVILVGVCQAMVMSAIARNGVGPGVASPIVCFAVLALGWLPAVCVAILMSL